VIETKDPDFRLLRDDSFGPVVDRVRLSGGQWSDTLRARRPTVLAIWAHRRRVRGRSKRPSRRPGALRYAAGTSTSTDKPTGAVVGQQPFGGGPGLRNERQGRLDVEPHRWVSPRTIKETFVPPTTTAYPFMARIRTARALRPDPRDLHAAGVFWDPWRSRVGSARARRALSPPSALCVSTAGGTSSRPRTRRCPCRDGRSWGGLRRSGRQRDHPARGGDAVPSFLAKRSVAATAPT